MFALILIILFCFQSNFDKNLIFELQFLVGRVLYFPTFMQIEILIMQFAIQK